MGDSCEKPRLANILPELARELKTLLEDSKQPGLAAQVDNLTISSAAVAKIGSARPSARNLRPMVLTGAITKQYS